jgi:integrase
MALGRWPELSLTEARRLLAIGADPARPQRSSAPSFAEIATKADAHRVSVFRRLHRDILPFLGERPVNSITAPQVLAVVRQIEARGAIETAHRALQNIGQILRYAVATGRAEADVTASLRGALAPVRVRHMPAPADDPARVGAALRLLPYLFVRLGELRAMLWRDVDLDAAEWRFTASKTRLDHVVPLPCQSVRKRDPGSAPNRAPLVVC